MNILLCVGVIGIAVAISIPLGRWMFYVMCPSQETRFEKLLQKTIGKYSQKDQNWKQYGLALMLFNLLMFTFVWMVLSLQHDLPLNPDGQEGISSDLIYNTVASFTTNTNLQHYSGESTLSYCSQIFGLMWLQFVSAATGLATVTAVARWLGNTKFPNNFYCDLGRATFGILLPLATIVALLLVLCGIPMTFEGAAVIQTLEGVTQTIARGPVAAFVSIKQLGTNGGGFFGPNSTHPLENVNFYSNLVETLSMIIIPMACVWLFGYITNRKAHVRIIFSVMLAFLVVKLGLAVYWEQAPTPALEGLAVTQNANLEGKELRFGAVQSPLWATFTTCTSNGSVNSMHSSLNPLTSLIPLAGMWLNTTFGGIGVGFLGLFAYIVVAVFISGMMVGRTPEYLGKKVETREMKMAIPMLLLHPLCILLGVAIFCVIPSWGRDTVLNSGPHGFTEILYEFTSASANNGSGFEGLGDNTVPWNIATGIVMLLGRFIPILISLAIAGSLFAKKEVPETIGTLKTDTPLFGVVLMGTLVFIGALLFLPVAVLGPIAEHFGLIGW
ncbi:MAG: potassium-transporting ATPase subunit KdpA [Thermoguttaceae bacterium]|nr:potassium-transporting ATPase subunit KdpA [Thermoguttaceae bacterium]